MTNSSHTGTKVTVLLDFDGVINPTVNGKPPKHVHKVWKSTWLGAGHEAGPFHVYYSPVVVNAINDISLLPHVKILWLTTWERHSSEFSTLGFRDFDYVALPTDLSTDKIRMGEWKRPAAESIIDDPDSGYVVWVDDSIPLVRGINIGRPNVEVINPHSSDGLSTRRLRALREAAEAFS